MPNPLFCPNVPPPLGVGVSRRGVHLFHFPLERFCKRSIVLWVWNPVPLGVPVVPDVPLGVVWPVDDGSRLGSRNGFRRPLGGDAAVGGPQCSPPGVMPPRRRFQCVAHRDGVSSRQFLFGSEVVGAGRVGGIPPSHGVQDGSVNSAAGRNDSDPGRHRAG